MSDGGDRPAPRGDADPWHVLRGLTPARIGLQRTGASLATGPLLAFQLAHAQARDAVRVGLDVDRLVSDIGSLALPALVVSSAAPDRHSFLMRPDLGRALHPDSEARLRRYSGTYDVVFIVSGGLSAGAAQKHAAAVVGSVLPMLRAESRSIAPLVVVERGRVAIGDRIAGLVGADCAIVLIGERPGLSAPESLGAYVTWRPGADTTDADRNCISNIRPDGIDYSAAGFKLAHLLRTMRTLGLSGVRLKDHSDRMEIDKA